MGFFHTPWAYDANGTPLPTHFEIEGTSLFRVVEHKGGDFQYGITADPAWSAKWYKKIKRLLMACLGLSIGSELTLRALFPTVQSAAKFVVRRVGLMGAIFCGGGIIKELL